MIVNESDDTDSLDADGMIDHRPSQGRLAIESAAFESGAGFDAVAHARSVFDAVDYSDRTIRDVTDRMLVACRHEIDASDSIQRTVIETYRGHVARYADEAFDSLDRFVKKVTDNARQEIALADGLIESTPARPVRTREEASYVLTLPSVTAAELMVADKAGAFEESGIPANQVNGSQSGVAGIDIKPGTEQQSIQQRVDDVVRNFNASMINASGPHVTSIEPGPFAPPANTPGYTILGPDDPDSACWNHNSESPRDVVNEIIDLKSQGGTIDFIDTNSFPPFAGQLNYILNYPPGYLNVSQPFSVQFAEPGDPRFQNPSDPNWLPTREESRNAFPEIPYGFTIAGGGPTGLCYRTPEPTPEPTVPVSCPAAPEPTCCPPDPVERDEIKANIKFHQVPVFTDKYATWCDFITSDIKTAEPQPGTEPPSGGQGAASGDGDGYAVSGNSGAGEPPVSSGAITFKRIAEFFKWEEKPAVGSPTEAMINSFAYGQRATSEWIRTLDISQSSIDYNLRKHGFILAAAGWLETVTGAPIKYMARPIEHKFKYLYPVEIPGQSDIDAMYLFNVIDNNEWECYTRSLGNLPMPHRNVRDIKQERLNVSEIVEMYMREHIDFQQLYEEMRRRGVLDDKNIDGWIKLREQLPQMPDIIRFMVRDVENREVVEEGNLADGFTENFQGNLKKWAQQQGVSDKVALYQWMAHWDLPSPTAANEMLRRLRPGRVPGNIEVTSDQIMRLYSAADMAPGWREKMMAISYNVPTRTDIKQGYIYGAFKRDEAIEALQDTGLDKKGADFVARLLDIEKDRATRVITERDQLWTKKNVLRKYSDGMITVDEAMELLDGLGYPREKMQAALASAEILRIVTTREECIKGIKRRYYVGAIDEAEAVKRIRGLDTEFSAAPEIVKQWQCHRSAGLQEVPARKNVEWAVSGVITLDELSLRLQRLRYSNDDVNRFVAEAITKIRDLQAKAIKKAIQEQIAEARARLAEYRKQIQEREKRIKELEKREKELKKNQENNE